MKALKIIFKLSPVALLAWLLLAGKGGGEGFDMLIAGPLALMYAGFVAYCTEGIKPADSIETAVENVRGIQLVFFILMMAYAMAGSFMQTGVGAATVNLALSAGLSAKTVAPVGLLVTAVLSVATGTSWGTFANLVAKSIFNYNCKSKAL